ncbi:MAG TPA: sulfite exporter TauE/SafE family protein [Pirellulales bacterium]
MIRDYCLLCLAAALAGAVNSVAGGGTLLSFPVLFAVLARRDQSPGVASVVANATSTVALFPGSLAAIWGYRRELQTAWGWVWLLTLPSLLGGLLGSCLLTSLPEEWFLWLVPWLILTAALLFALQPLISRLTGIGRPHTKPGGSTLAGIVLFQFGVAIYGGYFGAGIGILMLSALAMMGMADIHVMNGLKSWLGSCINGVAVVVFIVGGRVDWPLALAMAVAGAIGGYGGASIARKLNRNLVRRAVVAIGFSLAGWYFYQQWSG